MPRYRFWLIVTQLQEAVARLKDANLLSFDYDRPRCGAERLKFDVCNERSAVRLAHEDDLVAIFHDHPRFIGMFGITGLFDVTLRTEKPFARPYSSA